VALERLEFTVSLTGIAMVHRWVYLTLRTITSPVFNEFVIWLLDTEIPWTRMSRRGWADVDVWLNSIAQRNPDFRVVFKGNFSSFRDSTLGNPDRVRTFITSFMPLVSSNHWAKFEYVSRAENRGRLGVLSVFPTSFIGVEPRNLIYLDTEGT